MRRNKNENGNCNRRNQKNSKQNRKNSNAFDQRNNCDGSRKRIRQHSRFNNYQNQTDIEEKNEIAILQQELNSMSEKLKNIIDSG